MQLGSLRLPGILAPWGRHVGSGCQNWQNQTSRRPTRVGFCGDLVKPSLDSRALISPRSCASGFGLPSRWLPAVPRGDGRASGQKTARKAKSGDVATTVRCITPARPEEQIRSSRADPLSYATGISTPFWLGPLPHGDMVSPNWPKMAKTATIGRKSPHPGSHIPMVMASNDLTKVGRDIWGLDPNICPMSSLYFVSNHFSSERKNGTRKMTRGSIPHIEPPMALPSQGEDTRGYTLFEVCLCPLSKAPLTLDNG